MRSIATGIGLALALFAGMSAATAQNYPEKAIAMVVPNGAGGAADMTARMMADLMSKELGQPIAVENKPGAGGNIAAEAVAKASPDGYTIMLGSNATHAANLALYANPPVHPLDDFEPVIILQKGAMLLLASNQSRFKTLEQVIEEAKANPAALNVGVASTSARVALELLSQAAGVQFTPVSYKEVGMAFTDLLGGNVDLLVDTMTANTARVKAGEFAALGVSMQQRSPHLPDVPTFAEKGYTAAVVGSWTALFAPKGTDRAIVDVLNATANKVLRSEMVQEAFARTGSETVGNTPEEAAAFVRDEIELWGRVIREAGLQTN